MVGPTNPFHIPKEWERILEWYLSHPEMSRKQIAELCGCSTTTLRNAIVGTVKDVISDIIYGYSTQRDLFWQYIVFYCKSHDGKFDVEAAKSIGNRYFIDIDTIHSKYDTYHELDIDAKEKKDIGSYIMARAKNEITPMRTLIEIVAVTLYYQIDISDAARTFSINPSIMKSVIHKYKHLFGKLSIAPATLRHMSNSYGEKDIARYLNRIRNNMIFYVN